MLSCDQLTLEYNIPPLSLSLSLSLSLPALLHVYLTITHFKCDIFNIKMIFTCTELLETRQQIVNIIFKSIIIKMSVSELINK